MLCTSIFWTDGKWLIMKQQTCIILYSTSENENIIYPKGRGCNNLQPSLLPLGYALTKWISTSLPGLAVWLTWSPNVPLSKKITKMSFASYSWDHAKGVYPWLSLSSVTVKKLRWWYFLKDLYENTDHFKSSFGDNPQIN